MKKEEIELIRLETGLLWPHYQKKKAWSASTLTKILKEMEYKDIPPYVLQKAAERGRVFHEAIQNFFQTNTYPSFVDLLSKSTLSSVEKRVHEVVNFLKKNKSLKPSHFLGKEKLYYAFHKDSLLATYIDLEFQDYIIELKSSNIKANESPFALLIFEIQLLIQHLCTGKSVYLLWGTGQGVIFNNFQISPHSLKILDILIDIATNEKVYSLDFKKAVIQEIINNYSPIKLIN